MVRVRVGRHLTALIGVLLVALTTGCGVLGADPLGAAGTPSPTTDSGESWIRVSGGSPSPSPSAVSRRSPSPSASPARPAAAAPPAAPAPTPTCAGNSRPGQLNGLTVVPGAGSATVSWYHAGDPALVGYRLAAVPQRLEPGSQASPDWRDVPAGAGCRTVTSTVDGLTSGAPYIFWLDAVSTATVGGGNRDISVGRSSVVTIG